MIGDMHYERCRAGVIGPPLHGGHAEAPTKIVRVTMSDVA